MVCVVFERIRAAIRKLFPSDLERHMKGVTDYNEAERKLREWERSTFSRIGFL